MTTSTDTGIGLPRPSTGAGGQRPFVPDESPFADVSALETWAAANPSELHNGSDEHSVITVLVVTDNTGMPDTSANTYEWGGEDEPASYTPVTDRGSWVIHTALDAAEIKSLYESNPNTNALTDPSTVAVNSLLAVPAGVIPVATATGTGPSSMTEMNDEILSTKTLDAPDAASLRMGNWQLANGGTTVIVKELASNRELYVVGYQITETGSMRPFWVKYSAPGNTPSGADMSETFTGASIQFKIINANAGRAESYVFSSTKASTDCNLTIRVVSHTHTPAIFDYKRSTGGTGFDLSAGLNTIPLPNPTTFDDAQELFVTITAGSGETLSLRGQTLTVGGTQETVTYVEVNGRTSEDITLLDEQNIDDTSTTDGLWTAAKIMEQIEEGTDHPVTLRRDMPTEVDAAALAAASLNGNSAMWVAGNDQVTGGGPYDGHSNRADATIVAQRAGFFDLEGNEIPTTPTAANTIQLRSGTVVRVFAANDYRIVNAPVFESDITTPERSRTIELTSSYTAQASDFAGVDHVFYRFNNTGQVDFNIPISVVPDNITLSVKEVGTGGATHRVLVQAVGGTIDGETDHLLSQEQAILLHKGTLQNQLDIAANFEPGSSSNNYVTGGSFSSNTINLTRVGLSSVSVPLDINDIDNEVSGLPVSHPLNLTGQDATRQTIGLGSLSLDWSSLSGGKVGVRLYFQTQSSGGFLPDFQSLSLNYGSGALVLTFNVSGVGPDDERIYETTIPDGDYSAILNTDPVGTLVVDVRGFSWVGQMQIREMYNRQTSLIHSDVEAIAAVVADQELLPVQAEADANSAKIANNRAAIDRLVQMVNNLPDQIPGPVLSWLINDVQIADVATPTLDPTPYNRQLASDNTQSVFIDSGQTLVGSLLQSTSMASTATRGQLMLEVMEDYADGATIVQSDDGSANTLPLLRRVGSALMAVRFVPAHGGGSRTVTHIPTPQNLVAHDWYDVPGHTPSLSAEADELFFTRDLPSVSTTVNIRYRYFANGSAGPTVTATLAGVGGPTDAEYQADLSLPDGESFHVIIQWRAANRQLVYEAVPRASNPNFFIFDTQIHFDWEETVTEPSFPATTENIRIGPMTDSNFPLAMFMPSEARSDSNAATLVIFGTEGQVDTGYAYNELFTNTDVGRLDVVGTTATEGWYQWEKFTPSASLVTEFSSRRMQPYQGWFVQNFNHLTVAQIGTQVQVKDTEDNDVLAGSELYLKSPNGTVYEVTVDNAGTLATTEIP